MKSSISHAVLDIGSRKRKAAAILEILEKYKDIKKSKILDIGTGSGIISHEMGKKSRHVSSVDIRDERVLKSNYKFRMIGNEGLPFGDKQFDIVVSNHVMAHVKNGEKHLEEIRRVLKDNGIVYLSMLNRLWPYEPNFGLFFLSWLPKKLANLYVRLSGKGREYDVTPLTYWSFARKLERHFEYEDVTFMLVRKKIGIPEAAYRVLKAFSPVWVFILRGK